MARFGRPWNGSNTRRGCSPLEPRLFGVSYGFLVFGMVKRRIGTEFWF